MFDESIIIIITLALMFFSLLLIFIPVVPVTALEWAIAVIFGAVTGFSRMPILSVVIVTVLMILGVTSNLWMPIFGLRGRQISCMAMVAFFVGMILGAAIPVPIIGSFIGGMMGVMIVEYMRTGDHDHAIEAGESAVVVMMMSMVLEFLMAGGIVLVTVISIIGTA
jgi:uncharacterized protein YqgC (DUF456 family)